MTKYYTQIKEPVTIRFKKLANGNQSIYLDIYRGGVRTYEFLKLYIIPERNVYDKAINKATIDAAAAIKVKRAIEIINSTAGIKKDRGTDISLLEWMKSQQEKAANNIEAAGRIPQSSASSIKSSIIHITNYINKYYKGHTPSLSDIDKAFCSGFAQYLRNTKKMMVTRKGPVEHKSGANLSASSCRTYYSKLAAALNKAYKMELIPSNPANKLVNAEKAKIQQTERIYLTAEELRAMTNTYCPNKAVKSAFIFSCLSGLRWSDIKSLTWDKINSRSTPWQLETRMMKTQKLLYLPLSAEAVKFLPPRPDKNSSEATVFDLPSHCQTTKVIKKWSKRAEINKNITFHSARHTFATLMITLGADIYTTSKLLGHSDIKTTQIYAAVVDKKKQDAVNLTNGLLG